MVYCSAESSLQAMVSLQNAAQSAQDLEQNNDLISLAAQIAMEVSDCTGISTLHVIRVDNGIKHGP